MNQVSLAWYGRVRGIQEQKWEDRKKHLTKFLRDITEDFRSLRIAPSFAVNKELQKQECIKFLIQVYLVFFGKNIKLWSVKENIVDVGKNTTWKKGKKEAI